jgi:hypothetical protein
VIRLVEHDAGSTFSPAPIISVDRAVWYRVTDIEFDYQGISAYYANLPYPDKPPLEDCHIHISALACVVKRGKRGPRSRRAAPQEHVDSSLPPAIRRRRERFFRKNVLIDGVNCPEPSDAALYDPQAPSADVLLLLGFSIFLSDLSRLVHALETQLAAYACGKDACPPMSSREKQLREELKRWQRADHGEAAGLTGAVEGAVEGGAPSLISLDSPVNTLISIGFGAADHVVASRSKWRAHRKVRNGLLAFADEREAAIGADPPPISLSAHSVRVQLRGSKGLRNTMIRAPYGRKGLGSVVDRAIDQGHATRSFHQVSLTHHESTEYSVAR